MSSDKQDGGLPNPCKKNHFYHRYEYDCMNLKVLESEYTAQDKKCRAIYEGFACITDNIELHTGVRCDDYIKRFRGYIRRNFSVDIEQCDFSDPSHGTTASPTRPTRTREPTFSPTNNPAIISKTTKKPKTRGPVTEPSTHRTSVTGTSRVTTTSGVHGNSLSGISDYPEVDPAIIIGCIVGGSIVVALLTLFLWRRKCPNACKSNADSEEVNRRDDIIEQHRRKQGLQALQHMSNTYEIPNSPCQSKDRQRSTFIQPTGPYKVHVTTEQQMPFQPNAGVAANIQEDIQSPHYQNVEYMKVDGTPEHQYEDTFTEDLYTEISVAEVGHSEYEQLRSPFDKTNDRAEYLQPIQSPELSSPPYLTLECTGNENGMSNSRNENIFIPD